MKRSQYNVASTSENGDEKTREFPEIDHIGLHTMGMYLILSMPLILSSVRSLGYVFTTGKVSYRCLVPECENPVNTTLNPSWLSNAVPFTNGEPDTCTRFIVKNSTESCSTTVFTNETESCDSWVYDPGESTILNEWDLTCSNNLWKLTLPGTMNNAGQFIGLVISGHLSDKYGRRNMVIVCTTISSVFGLIRSFSVNYEMFITFEFLDCMAGSAVFSAVFILGMELVGPKKRTQAINIPNCMCVVYSIFLGLFASWLRSWRLLLRVFYIPGFFAAILLRWLIPESVRWLQSKGRLEEAEATLRQIAAKNKIEVSERSILMIRNSKKENLDQNATSNTSRISVLREITGNRTILLRLMICAFCWMANTFVYYGLSLRSVAVAGDKYVNFILVTAVEIPAYFASSILADNLGRKPTLITAHLLSGIFCILSIFVPTAWYLPIIVFVIGKFCITISFNLVYVFTTEIFPTKFRHSLLSLCSMFGRTGSMLAPQTPLLANYMPSLPQLLFGIIAILASLLSLNFPETLGVRLPDTISEAENIGKVKKEEQTIELSELT